MANESQNILPQDSLYGTMQEKPEKQLQDSLYGTMQKQEEETINIPDSSSIEAPSAETLAAEAFDKEVAFDTFIDKYKEDSDTIFIEATREENNVSQEDSDQTISEEHTEKFKHDAQKKEIDKLEAEAPDSIWWTVKEYANDAKRLAQMPAAGVMQMGENVLSRVGAVEEGSLHIPEPKNCLLYTSPSPRD